MRGAIAALVGEGLLAATADAEHFAAVGAPAERWSGLWKSGLRVGERGQQ